MIVSVIVSVDGQTWTTSPLLLYSCRSIDQYVFICMQAAVSWLFLCLGSSSGCGQMHCFGLSICLCVCARLGVLLPACCQLLVLVYTYSDI